MKEEPKFEIFEAPDKELAIKMKSVGEALCDGIRLGLQESRIDAVLGLFDVLCDLTYAAAVFEMINGMGENRAVEKIDLNAAPTVELLHRKGDTDGQEQT